MINSTPYTYLIKHKSSGLCYYGVRFAEGCSPSDLFTTYFTSSKIIHRIIKKEGVDSFEYEIRKVFSSSRKAQEWELRVLKKLKVPNNEKLFNKGLCTPPNHSGIKKTKEHREKISVSNLGKHSKEVALYGLKFAVIANTGKKRPEHSNHIKKLRKEYPEKFYKFKPGPDHPLYGKKLSEKHKKQISENSKLRPKVCCISCHKTGEEEAGIWTCHFFNHHKNCNNG